MRVEHGYDTSPGRLLAVLTDPEFLAARSARFGGTGSPTVSREAGRTVVRTPRALPLDAVPGPLRRLAGDGRLVQVDEWTDTAGSTVRGRWTAETAAPVELGGTHDISGDGDGCRYAVTARVRVRVPVVGRTAERAVTDHLTTLVRRELEFAAAWLRR